MTMELQSQAAGAAFYPGPIRTLAVHCSDGRFASACEQFITEDLGIQPCDRVVVPGGPTALLDPNAGQALMEQTLFLIEAHAIERVLLIAHEDCGYYKGVLGVEAEDQSTCQPADLIATAEMLTEACPQLRIETYRATLDGDAVRFVPVP